MFEKLSSPFLGKGNKFTAVSDKKTDEYNIPIVYAKFGDNGIMYWAKKGDFKTHANVLSVIYNGAIAAGLVYAQDEPTGILAESYLIKFTDKKVSFLTNLYFSCVLTHVIYPKYSRELLATWANKVENEMISLPTTKQGKIDFEYMENYIQKIINGCLKDLDKFITASQLSSSKLTSAEKKAVEDFENGNIKFAEFRIGDLFEIKKGTRLTKADMKSGNINFIGSTATNNGLTAKIANNEKIHPKNTITVSYNGSVGEAFYQNKDFWASDDINVLYSNFIMTENLALFFCSVLRKKGKKYAYSFKWTKEKMENDFVSLPSTNSDEVNYDFMENYISAQKKMAMKGVVENCRKLSPKS